MVNTFQLNKKYGEWAERTVYTFLKRKKGKLGIDIFYFGSQVITTKKDDTDAPSRPDFIMLKLNKVKMLERKYGLKFDNINLNRLFKLIEISNGNKRILQEDKEYWITKVLDKEPLMRDIVKNTYCMIEVKSGFGIFNEEKYKKGKLNLMLPINFRRRVNIIQKRFNKRFPVYGIYVLLDRAYIANMEKIFNEGQTTEYTYDRIGRSEVKHSKFKILPFNKSYLFGYVGGIIIKKNNIPRLIPKNAKPIIEIINGAIRFSLKMKTGKLVKADLSIIRRLKR